MSMLSQGTNIYFYDAENTEVVTVQCATSLNPGGSPADQIEDTCLEATIRSYKRGLRTPGQATMGINFDSAYTSHMRMNALNEMAESPTLMWAVGFSDGTAPPTVNSAGAWVLPTTRTWFTFSGYISDFPYDIAVNGLVATTVTIQRTGGSSTVKKV